MLHCAIAVYIQRLTDLSLADGLQQSQEQQMALQQRQRDGYDNQQVQLCAVCGKVFISSSKLAYICVQVYVNAMNFVCLNGMIAHDGEGKRHHSCLLCQSASQAVDHMCVAFDTQV